MKKTIISLALAAIAISAGAQKTSKVSVDYELTMYPRNLISKDNSVNVVVESNYTALVEERKAQFTKLSDEESKKSTGKKVFEKALSKTVFDPNNPTAESVIIPTLVGEETASSVKIEGLTENNSAKGIIKLVFYPMEVSSITSASFNYVPLRVDVTITNDKGVKIYDGVLGVIKGAHTYSLAGSESYKAGYFKAESKAKDESLAQVNDFLKKEYAYLKMKDDRRFYDVSDKKQQYPEYHTAVEKVKSAFAYLTVESKKAEREAALKEAVALWQESLKQLDKSNKDARINKDIAAATYLNIAEASIWLNEFDKSKEALAEYKILDEDYSKTESAIIKFHEEYSKRYNAYNLY